MDLQGNVGRMELAVRLSTPADGPSAVIGPSGAGKSSLLLMILGFLPVPRGYIRVDGRPLLDIERGVNLPPEARRLGYLPQEYALFPHMTVLDNVRFGLARHRSRLSREGRQEKAVVLLERLGVRRLSHRLPGALSGGERQRVALARALARDPDALLLDEPLAALDATTRRGVRAFLAEQLRALGLPTIVVTHDPEDAAALANQMVVLEGGRVVQQGNLSELRAAPATRFVADFTSGGGG